MEFDVRQKDFASRQDAVNWIIDNQLGRRNLDGEAIGYLQGKRYLAEKLDEGRPEKLGQNVPVIDRTSEKLSEQFGVNEKTIRRNADFAIAVDTLAEADILPVSTVMAGKSPLTKQDTVELAKIVQEEPCKPNIPNV